MRTIGFAFPRVEFLHNPAHGYFGFLSFTRARVTETARNRNQHGARAKGQLKLIVCREFSEAHECLSEVIGEEKFIGNPWGGASYLP